MSDDCAPGANQPKISIITPTFNAASNIPRFLESISAQTFKDFELLVIDGASSDDTISQIQRLGESLKSLRFVSEPDHGIYDAMNKGMSMARGEWLYFLGADDTLASARTLERVAEQLDDQADLVYGRVRNLRQGFISGARSLKSLFLRSMCHQAIFYRRSFAQRIGRYNVQFRIYSDWDYNLRCFASSSRIRHIDEVICDYSGYGISSIEVDQEFESKKYELLCSYTKKNLLSPTFAHCRYDFYKRALSAGSFPVVDRVGYMALFLYHAGREKLTPWRPRGSADREA